MIGLKEIQSAQRKILPYINKTPLIKSNYLSQNESNIFLKLESMQITGSFKFRGALNKLLNLSADQKEKGVVAVSTGNHGKGVAYASNILKIKSLIFMSKLVPEYRKKAIEDLGAQVKIIGDNSDEADKYATDYAIKNNIEIIHPFDDLDIICGQGTIGLEMFSDLPEVDTIVVPTSGGGLIGGIAMAVKLQTPSVKIIGVSMKKGPSMYESLKHGKPVDVIEEETLADCLGGSIGLNNKYTFNIAKKYIDDFVLVDENQIAEGIKINFEKHKIISEGAAATGVIAIRDRLSKSIGKNVICLICGGNINSELFAKIIS
ncbi:MAG: hydroxyectoine utilization dehydratase EutB [Pelagibacteraceae bacterium]|nr:hydroxyectoine utilization dehydratase EutB [Pelagibacteraceae bacterium]|tara:strand:- start:10816 stop:11769 length:954 start_codon:yes stop_codon:yes gene_type:complete